MWQMCVTFFYVHMTVRPNKVRLNKTNRRTNFQILFWYTTIHVSGSHPPPAHHQELSTVLSALLMMGRGAARNM